MNKFIKQIYPNFFEGVQNKAQQRCALAITLYRENFAIYIAVFETEYYMKTTEKKIFSAFKRGLKAKYWGHLKLGQSYLIRLTLTLLSFLTQIFKEIFSLNTT